MKLRYLIQLVLCLVVLTCQFAFAGPLEGNWGGSEPLSHRVEVVGNTIKFIYPVQNEFAVSRVTDIYEFVEGEISEENGNQISLTFKERKSSGLGLLIAGERPEATEMDARYLIKDGVLFLFRPVEQGQYQLEAYEKNVSGS